MSSDTSSPHSVEIHVTPPRKSSTPVSADTRSDILRESVEIRGKRDGDASSLLQQNLVYGSEMDALLRAPAFKHQGMSSCPELSRRTLNSPKLTPPSSNSPRRRRSPAFHSHPVTPRTFRLNVLGRAGADDLGSDRTGGDSPVGRGGGYLGDIGPGSQWDVQYGFLPQAVGLRLGLMIGCAAVVNVSIDSHAGYIVRNSWPELPWIGVPRFRGKAGDWRFTAPGYVG
ncbi:hypothetical protein BHE90_006980 [Fusarium euwallaceae]|uniref:Uncharacterized protein n=1 Tax=Fusarium euwallaceae TaxID=1147111 RepID=A0A430LS70_9HYPO|nr:hypothetical protein BHE90_006980 [Fusarium euwallaceae]